MNLDLGVCLRCPEVFHARSQSPRCPKCKAWGALVRVLDWDDLVAVVREKFPLVSDSTVRVEDREAIAVGLGGTPPPSMLSPCNLAPPVRAKDGGPQTSPTTGARPLLARPPFLDERLDLDRVERLWWKDRVDTYSLTEQRVWLREKLAGAFLVRATHAELDSIREKFLDRGPPPGGIEGI